MKLRQNRGVPQANRIFTDREEPRNCFWKNYNNFKNAMLFSQEVKVLTYYGIGGIGKSSLLKKLILEMNERLERPRYVYFDFNINQESHAVLEYLKNKLTDQYGYFSPLFELGMYIYAKKIGENVSSPEIKTFVERSKFLSLTLNVAEVIPVVGTLAKFVSIADTGITYIRNIVEKHKFDIKEIEEKDANDLYNYLPYLFAKDMEDNLQDVTEPLVVFFDTYEQLVNEMASIGEPLNNDLWLRGTHGLIQNIPNVLWVIAGREKIKWERFDNDWTDSLEQHILGTLSKTDGINFLNSAGISNIQLCEQLYELTQGTPVYLDLCVDRYTFLTEQGNIPKVEDFGNNVYSLIERFARYMDDNKKDLVYMLSCLKMWDDEMVINISNRVLPTFSMTNYEKVKGFSFITSSDVDRFNIHQTVSTVLYDDCPKYIKTKTFACAIEYCQTKLNTLSTFSMEYSYYLQWLMKYALQNYDDTKKLHDFYVEKIHSPLLELCNSGKFSTVNDIFEPLWNLAVCHKNSIIYAVALKDYSLFSRISGNYTNIEEYSQKAYSIYLSIFGEENSNTNLALINYATTLNTLGNYNIALDLYNKCFEIRKEILGENHPKTISTMNNLANTYQSLGQYDKALPLRLEVLKKYKAILDENHPDTISAMNNLANLYQSLGQYDETLPLRLEVLEKRKKNLGESHPDTISAMNNLSWLYQSLGKYDKALTLRLEVLSKRKEVLGENHPNTISAMNNLASTYQNLGKYDKALPLRLETLSKRREVLGENHPETISALSNLSSLYQSLGKYDETLPLRLEVLQKRKEILGESHPYTILTMNNLAQLYHLTHNTELGLSYIQKAISTAESLKDFNMESILNYRNTLAILYADDFQADKAIHLALDTLEQFKEHYPKLKVNLACCYYTVAYAYVKLEQYSEALPYIQTAYELHSAIHPQHCDTLEAKELLKKVSQELKKNAQNN